jgi:hypothetical protein
MSPAATATSSVALVQEAVPRPAEVPELASMALLSVVLAGVSMMVRRVAPRSNRKAHSEPQAPPPRPAETTPAEPTREAYSTGSIVTE